MLCVPSILLPFTVQPSASTGCSPCSTSLAARKARFQAIPLQYRAERRSAFCISVAVAGFTDADLSIEAKENTLTIRGEKQTDDEEPSGEVLYKGIAERTFERSFQLADHVVARARAWRTGSCTSTSCASSGSHEAPDDPDREAPPGPEPGANQGRRLRLWP